MSYTVLARRYRSGTFDEVVGQGHVAQTLKRAIEAGRVAHAYLFCGTRGVGKTSMARILAKALNCQAFDKPTTEPCNQCASCVAIARGEDVDVVEIDAASNTQVDKTREVVIDNVNYRPLHSRFKVYIIDEVHMLSKSSFNALLKTLEEPPSHVKFILATTEPEKIPNTILSRCQRYDFRNIPTREIADHLKEVTASESVRADEEALLLIAKAGAGSMRDSLSLLDRLLSVGEKHLTVEMVEGLLGLPKSQLMFDLAQAIGEGDTKGALTRADAIINNGLSPDSLVASMVDHLRNLLILKTCGPDSQLVEVPGLAVKDLTQQAERFDAVALAQDIALLEELRRQMRSSSAGRALLDATIVRLALADQFASVGELLARTLGGGDGSPPRSSPRTTSSPASAPPTQKKNPEPVAQFAQPAPVSAPVPIAAAPVAAPSAETFAPDPFTEPPPAPVAPPAPAARGPLDDEDDDLPRPGKVWESGGPSLSELLKQQKAQQGGAPAPQASAPAAPSVPSPGGVGGLAEGESNVEAVNPKDLPEVWQALLDLLAQKGPGLPSLLVHGRFVGVEDGRAVIRYAKQHETFVKMFERNGKRDQVREALSQVLNQNVGVVFDVEKTPENTAASPAPGAPGASSNGSHVAPAPPMRFSATPPPAARAEAPQAPLATRPSPEQIAALKESDPLIKGLMEQFGAQILKIE